MPATTTIAPNQFRDARKAIMAAGIGNLLEYYDFAVYGFLATVIYGCGATCQKPHAFERSSGAR